MRRVSVRVTAITTRSLASTAIDFKQSIGATEALRTGSYAKTLTLTLSTTAP